MEKQTRKSLRVKLYEAKSEMGKISKDSTNPFFKSKYFDINSLLEHVEPILNKHRILLLQPIVDNALVTMFCDVDTDDKIESIMLLPTLNDPQKLGSAITYFRRYAIQSFLCLQAEDDDANRASRPAKQVGLEELNEQHPKWEKAKAALKAGSITMEQLKKNYHVTGKL